MRKLTLQITYETRAGHREEQECEVEREMIAGITKHLLDMPEVYCGNNANGPIVFVTDVEHIIPRTIEYQKFTRPVNR